MKYIWFFILFFTLANGDKIDLGIWNKQKLSNFLSNNWAKSNSSKVINITDKFLGTPYKAHTLIGSREQKEELVIDLAHLDCFTFVDYVEAMKLSNSFDEFKTNLINLRYQEGKVEYIKRNHFLSDWIIYNGFENITPILSLKTKSAIKTLNQSAKNTPYLQGIKQRKTTIYYIDSKNLNKEIISKLETGDYIGIYTPKAGLDVTHVGIFIRQNGKAYFRHASSKKEVLKVVDEAFESYIKNTSGFIVLR